MNYDEQNFYVTRTRKGHDSFFAPVRSAKKVASVVDTVFKPHPAVFDGKAKLLKLGELKYKNGRFNDKEIVRALFYDKYYVPTHIYSGIKIDSENRMTHEKFCHNIVADPGPNENQIYFLLGVIGCGKTAFVNDLLTNQGKDWFVQEKLFFIRVSAYYIRKERGKQRAYLFEDLIRKMMGKTVKVAKDAGLETNPTTLLGSAFTRLIDNVGNRSNDQRLRVFRDFIECARREEGFRFLFVVDNIDYIFHIDDEKLFSPKFKSKPPAFNSIDHLMNLFKDSTKLGKLGTNVVLVLRPDSYRLLKESSVMDSYQPFPDLYQDQHAYTLAEPPLQDLVQKRLEMVKEILIRLPTGVKDDLVKSLIRPLGTFFLTKQLQLDYKKPLMAILPQLATFGLRDIVEFCATYTWVRGRYAPHETGIDRFLEHFHAGLIAFILRGHNRFSEELTQFPNIYLTKDTQYALQDDTTNIPNYYWLKWFLIRYIDRQNSRGLSVRFQDIVNIFSGEGGYPEEVLRNALSCLGRVHGANVIHADLECRHGQFVGIRNLSLTRRGKVCLTEVFDHFVYLQLTVEDYGLRLPDNDEILELLAYDNKDYRYLVSDAKEYHDTLVPLILRKSGQVFAFLEILKYELEYEKKRFPAAFERLVNAGVTVDVDGIRTRLSTQVGRLLAYLKVKNYSKRLQKILKKTEELGRISVSKMYEELAKHVIS
jgi:hypothetical protein